MKTIADLRKLSRQDLLQRLEDQRALLVEQKRSRAAGELANPHAVKKTRRDIAAVLTLLRQQPVEASKEDKKEETK